MDHLRKDIRLFGAQISPFHTTNEISHSWTRATLTLSMSVKFQSICKVSSIEIMNRGKHWAYRRLLAGAALTAWLLVSDLWLHLMMLSAVSNGRMMNNELEGYRRKRSWPNLWYYPWICLDRLRKNTKNLSQDSRSPSRYLNPGPPNAKHEC
jgi:hypothetical protein